MKNKLKNIVSIASKYSLMLLFIFPILPFAIANIIFISFSIFSLLSWILNGLPNLWKDLRRNSILTIPFIPYLIEYCFFHNNSVLGFEVEKKLLFFIAPLSFAFYTSSLKLMDFKVYIRTFTVSLLLLSLYSLILLIINRILFDPASYAGDASILRTKFEDISKLHPTYFGFFASIAVFWIIFDFRNLSNQMKWLIGMSVSILIFIDFLVAAKMSIIIVVLGSLYIFYKVTPQKKYLLFGYSAMLALLVALFALIPSLSQRIFELKDIFSLKNLTYNSVNERKIIFVCSWNIFKDNIWFGVGSRNMQQYLNVVYWVIKYYPAFIKNYNSHNQFLTLGINYGVFDVLLFIGSIVFVIRKEWKNTFAILLIVSTITIMLTESILERQMGVYFFVLFMLLFYNNKKEIPL